MARVPAFIDTTNVLVEPAGPARWYRLVSHIEYEGVGATSVVFVRDHTSYAEFNYYVESESLGISGETTGKIHTNKTLELHGEGGVHHGSVSAVEGFEYLNGADALNTTFLSEAVIESNAQQLLQAISFSELEQKARYVAPVGTEAVVEFQGEQISIKLYESGQVFGDALMLEDMSPDETLGDFDGSSSWSKEVEPTPLQGNHCAYRWSPLFPRAHPFDQGQCQRTRDHCQYLEC